MPEKTSATPNEDAKAQALVAEFLEEKAREGPSSNGAGKLAHGRAIAIGVMSLVCAASWLAPYPTGATTTGTDPIVEAASARLSLFLSGAKVQEYKRRHGRLPSSLLEAGVSDPKLQYIKGIDTSFTIESSVAGQHITYDSNKDPRAVLGNALSVIERKSH